MVRGVFDPTGQGSVDPQDPVSHSFANNVPSYHTMESVLVLRNRMLKNNIPPTHPHRTFSNANKNSIAAAVLTSKVESFPVRIFLTHWHVARAEMETERRQGGGGVAYFFWACVLKKLLPDGIPKRFVFVLWLS